MYNHDQDLQSKFYSIDLDNDVWRYETWPTQQKPLNRSKLLSYFRRLLTKVHQIKYACAREIAVCNPIFRSMISCFFRSSWELVLNFCPKFWCFWAAKFFGNGPKLLTHLLKFGDDQPSDLRGRRWKKFKKRQQRFIMACAHHSWWAAIKITQR